MLPTGYIEQARALADEHGLLMHLDGARIFNAAVASGVAATNLTAPFDSVSCCLSKGLGAPVGSVLAGSREFVKEGKRWRKMLGGGMRQSGILAAGGIYALEHHIERLAEDHQNASRLAEGLATLAGVTVEPVQTNMVFAHFPEDRLDGLTEHLKEHGILVGGYGPGALRLVTHLDVSEADIEQVLDTCRDFL